nr:phage terminase small subunit P27 family [Cupriavidus sp. AcVe19-6a]
MPSPKPKPTVLKLLEGNPGRRPLPQHEIQPARGRLPSPPAHLDERAKAEWRRLAREMHRLGTLTMIDRGAFAVVCQAYSHWVVAEQALAQMAGRDPLTHGLIIKTTNGNVIQNPLVGNARRAQLAYLRAAVEFGMTPSARAGLEIKPSDDDDEEEIRPAAAKSKRGYL